MSRENWSGAQDALHDKKEQFEVALLVRNNRALHCQWARTFFCQSVIIQDTGRELYWPIWVEVPQNNTKTENKLKELTISTLAGPKSCEFR